MSAAPAPALTVAVLISGRGSNMAAIAKACASGKTLTASGSVADGNSGNNYAVTFVDNTAGTITAKAITVTAATTAAAASTATAAATGSGASVTAYSTST